jgi:RNA polymerase sigma-32 factor
MTVTAFRHGQRRPGYVAQVMSAPMLDREAERELIRRWREVEDEDALHRLVESHARLVVRIALRYRKTGVPLDDLIQEGNVGLIEAADRFDLAFDNRFSTYASWWIDSAIQSYVMRNASIVRLPTASSYRQIYAHLRRLRSRQVLGAGDSLDEDELQEVATAHRVRFEEVQRVDRFLATSVASLSAPIGDRDGGRQGALVDLIADDGAQPDEAALDRSERRHRGRWLRRALDQLNERERTIIRSRFLGDDGRTTLAQLGATFGVSKERIRQLEGQALRKLRHAMRDYLAEVAD